MATILPPAVTTFFDADGNPLADGRVYFYIPTTDSPKDTYQNSAGTILNTNPVVLDSSGEAVIYGSGIYRQVIYDADGNLIWDQLTASTDSGAFAWGGVSTGTANAQAVSSSSFSSQDGQQLGFIAGYTNNAALTVNPSGSGAIPVLRDSPTGPTPLTGGEVVAANEITMVYEAARGAFHLTNPAIGTMSSQNANAVAITGGSISGTTLILKQSAAPTPTAEGDTQWDTDDNQIKIGDGSGTLSFSDDSKLAVLAATDQVITGGSRVTPLALGTITTGTVTLDPGDCPLQSYTNGGAHTLAPGSNTGYIFLDITNNGSAGAITTAGWTKVVGSFATTNGYKYRCGCSISTAGSLLTIQAMQ